MTDQPVVHLIAAARPNFMKIAPLYHAFVRQGWARPVLVHTGQHYDANMSGDILRDLGLPTPDISLGIGSGSHAQQTAGVMLAYEQVCLDARPDFVVVVGDVNSTLAVTITAKKLLIPVGHLEAGLRSRDRTMPEEINRIVTDALCDLLWTPSPDADENLRLEGVPAEKIVRVGNIMMDAYEMMRPKITADPTAASLGLTTREYGVVTLHRPFNVDEEANLRALLQAITAVAERLPLVFPVHPRTRQRLESFGLWDTLAQTPNIHLLEPLSYIPFMSLVQNARLVITDSGGIQEETTYLGIPCLTLRLNTERPITITHGTNQLVTAETLLAAANKRMDFEKRIAASIDLWDGHTADRVVANLRDWMNG
ncbi:UDP-N-acetylglucosamine 2-epimerase (non-hydrolyzing) [bacterium]|nr:UDP-N-acetylglucosamine 2-epimerase (non-hydrolyzing) [bacterium]MCB2179233.1 UDP-N-acetylglucosamine 2-epimerase (non-hydrolyzing) [bacterium]